MNNFKNILLLSIALLCVKQSTAQDPRFSQFNNTPLLLNPSLTGQMDADVRLIANYRSQWGSVTVPYETMSASADLAILTGFLEGDYIGVGLMALNDQAGDSEFKNVQGQLSFAYHKAMNNEGNHFLSLGLQVGGGQHRINYNELLFDSQFDGDGLNTNLGSGEDIDRLSFAFLDVSTGLSWHYVPSSYASFSLGVSMAHLNEPNVSFYQDVENRLHRKTTVHAAGEFNINDIISLVPRLLIMRQGTSRETTLGTLLRFNLRPEEYEANRMMDFSIGAMHRIKDANILMAQFNYGPVGVTMSYDVNISSLAAVSQGQGGPEIALVFKTSFFQNSARGSDKPVICPKI